MAASPSPSSEDQFAIGSVLDGRYRIDAVLGTGGMGRVYRAEHTKIGKMVAIKVLHADLNRNREASQRFQREAIASGRLDHPNIVGVSDFGVLDDGACFLVMEVLEGESLGDRLARDHRIHWVEAIEILRGVLSGLRHAHERGVVHRDIKPDNIYLAHKDGDPVVKILDFGIAKLYAGSADDPASTRAGLTVGTPAYLSPEQAVGGEITPASDLYSATIVLYEMLAGRAPFEDKDPLSMLGAHVGRRPPAFVEAAPGVDIPAPLEEIVQRGLMKAAAERINTAGDYLAMLDAFSPPLAPVSVRHISGSMTPLTPSGEWAATRATGAGRAMPGTPPVGVPTPFPGMVPTPFPGMMPPGPMPPGVMPPGVMPHGMPTPMPGTPPVGVPTPMPSMMPTTPLSAPTGVLPVSSATPTSMEMASLPRAIRAVSLADVSEPIPLTWIVRSGVVVGLVIVGAIVLAIATHCNGSTSGTKPSAVPPVTPTSDTKPSAVPTAVPTPTTPSTKPPAGSPSTKPPSAPSTKPSAVAPANPTTAVTPATGGAPATGSAGGAPSPGTPSPGTAGKPAVTGKPAPATGKPATGTAKPLDRDAQLKLLIHDLELGKTCADRKAAIGKLVELHDARAVPQLKRARVRTGRQDDSNACLKTDAERAIKELSGTLK